MENVDEAHVLDYGQGGNSINPLRRVRVIYAIGVGVAWLAIIFSICQWPNTTNGADPRKAELFMSGRVTGGTAMGWLLIGLRRIVRSSWLRRDVITWLIVVANILATWPLLWTGYQ
jgi:hypothetical protein